MSFVNEFIKNKEYRKHIVLYLIFGVITTMVNWISFYIMRIFLPFIEENIANIVSIILAVVVAYFTNRKYVFHSTEKNVLREFITFCSSRAVTMIIEVGLFFILVTLLGFNEMFVKVAESIIIIILNYIFSKCFVFENK